MTEQTTPAAETASVASVPFKKTFFRRRKVCPFSGPNALKIDYKDIKLLQKFVAERGKIIPRRITSVKAKPQRELATAIKRARFLALMPYVAE